MLTLQAGAVGLANVVKSNLGKPRSTSQAPLHSEMLLTHRSPRYHQDACRRFGSDQDDQGGFDAYDVTLTRQDGKILLSEMQIQVRLTET
jgi:hypothetical protein